MIYLCVGLFVGIALLLAIILATGGRRTSPPDPASHDRPAEPRVSEPRAPEFLAAGQIPASSPLLKRLRSEREAYLRYDEECDLLEQVLERRKALSTAPAPKLATGTSKAA